MSAEQSAETVHMCPPGDSGLMPCCDRTPFEVPRSDRMASDAALVTCGCQCVGFTIRTDYGTGVEHDVDRSSCPIHGGETDA